jgi:hypothetical protein
MTVGLRGKDQTGLTGELVLYIHAGISNARFVSR